VESTILPQPWVLTLFPLTILPARFCKRLGALSTPARCEVLALVWIGQGDYGAAQLDKAVADAASITDLSADQFTSEADLHELLTKSLYELKLN
jgi:hypothetical protein